MHFHIGRLAAFLDPDRLRHAWVPTVLGYIKRIGTTDRISHEQHNVRKKSPALFRPAQAAG